LILGLQGKVIIERVDKLKNELTTLGFAVCFCKITIFWKREDGEKPSRTRRCNRERNLQKPLFDCKREGAGSRSIRKSEDLAKNALSTLRGLRGSGFWKYPFLRTGFFLCPARIFKQMVSSLRSAESIKKLIP